MATMRACTKMPAMLPSNNA